MRDGRVQRTVDLSSGTTQTTLALPNGNHLLRLRFVNAATQRDLLPPSDTRIVVASQQRL